MSDCGRPGHFVEVIGYAADLLDPLIGALAAATGGSRGAVRDAWPSCPACACEALAARAAALPPRALTVIVAVVDLVPGEGEP